MAKARDLGIITGHQQLMKKKRTGEISLWTKIKTLYDTLKDYRDAKDRIVRGISALSENLIRKIYLGNKIL